MLRCKRIILKTLFISFALVLDTFSINHIHAASTIIEDNIELDNKKIIYEKDNMADKNPDSSSELHEILGLSLSEQGGPLASSTIKFRGLPSSQLPIDLEGLRLNNPQTGLTDGNSIFLFAANRLALGVEGLSISLPEITDHKIKGIFGIGSLNTFKLGSIAQSPIEKNGGGAFIAMQVSKTDGNFSFASDAKNNNFYNRVNNDQSRLQILTKYERKFPGFKAKSLLALNSHKGGIPGFALSPTDNLRIESSYIGIATNIAKTAGPTEFSFNLANSFFDHRTHDAKNRHEQISSSAHEFTFGIKRLNLPEWLKMNIEEKLAFEQAAQFSKSRVGGGFTMSRESLLKGPLKPTIFSKFSLMAYSYHGLLMNKNLGFSVEPLPIFSLFTRLIRSQRLPTFLEMYASNQFFRGSKDLKKEGILDLELGSKIKITDFILLETVGFLGHLTDLIVYVPYHAQTLTPVNASSASRYGIDINLTVDATSWLGFESKTSLIRTHVKSTNAPLPDAPSFLGSGKIRLGREDFIYVCLRERFRGPASADMYGALKTEGYLLLDGIISASLMPFLALSFSATNILNNRTARDTYQIPLPGTVFFAQVEFGDL